MITGFIVAVSRSARTSRPGSAPMYVRRWPRISASSCTPPSDMRTNSRLRRARSDFDGRLARAGGPISVRMAPDRLSSATPRSWRSLRTAIPTIRSLTSSSPAWSASSTRALTGSRRSSERLPHGTAEPVEACGSSTLHRSRHPSAPAGPSSRSACSRTSSASRTRRSSACTPRRRSRRPRRAPSGWIRAACAGSTRAAASGAPDSTSSRIRRRTCNSASRSRRSRTASSEPLDDVHRLGSSTFCSNVRSASRRRSGSRPACAGLTHRAHEGRHTLVGTAQLEDLLDDGAVLDFEVVRLHPGGMTSGASRSPPADGPRGQQTRR